MVIFLFLSSAGRLGAIKTINPVIRRQLAGSSPGSRAEFFWYGCCKFIPEMITKIEKGGIGQSGAGQIFYRVKENYKKGGWKYEQQQPKRGCI